MMVHVMNGLSPVFGDVALRPRETFTAKCQSDMFDIPGGASLAAQSTADTPMFCVFVLGRLSQGLAHKAKDSLMQAALLRQPDSGPAVLLGLRNTD